MTLSLNEVEATAKRATRGAGYPWGYAEEAAKATRWLCAQGLDGCGSLAGLLSLFDRSEVAAWDPETDGGTWMSTGGRLCPLRTGAAISDRAASLKLDEIRLGPIAEPLMLLPFAAQAARQIGTPVRIIWPGVDAVTDGARLRLDGRSGPSADEVCLKAVDDLSAPGQLQTRAEPDPNAMETLGRFAHRTYAPATEESRRLGAGAGLSDND